MSKRNKNEFNKELVVEPEPVGISPIVLEGDMTPEMKQELMDQIEEKYETGELPTEPGQEFGGPPVTCHRCKGDGVWHSPRTGYRARTATEPLIDRNRKCSVCGGAGVV